MGNLARWACLSCGRKFCASAHIPFRFATWNVCTLLDNEDTDRPARRTALIATELCRYDVDIAALSETRLADEGSLSEADGGYTFFWKVSLKMLGALVLPFGALFWPRSPNLQLALTKDS